MLKKTNTKTGAGKVLASVIGFLFIALFTTAIALPSSFAKGNSQKECVQGKNLWCVEKSEVPKKWNWKKRDIKFDHMYPKNR